MVEVYASEEEQVESIKKWWAENWRSIFGGVALGLAIVFGWRYWVAYQTNLGEQASIHFEQLLQALNTGNQELVGRQTQTLKNEFGSSPYAVFAALAQARAHVDQGNLKGAQSELQWALDKSRDPGLQHIARLRLGRILLSLGDTAGAAELIRQVDAGTFTGEYAELEGDIALARKDLEQARTAFTKALTAKPATAAFIQMKLDDIAPVAQASQASGGK